MYDYIGLRTTNIKLLDVKRLQEIADNFNSYPTKLGGTEYKCKLKNLDIRINDYDTRIQGSPATYLYDNNIHTLKYKDIRKFIDKLSKELGIKAGNLFIFKLDITDNLEMDHAPITYKKNMGKCGTMEKVDHQYNGLYYRNKQHDIIFYEKLVEITDKRKKVPLGLENLKLLRYEYSIKKKVNNRIETQLLRLNDLSRPEIYIQTVDTWEKQFNKIEFLNNYVQDVHYSEGMDIMEYIMLCGIMHIGGEKKAIEEIDHWHRLKRISYDKAYNKKKKVKELIKNYCNDDEIDGECLIAELKRKVKEKAEENKMLLAA